MSEEIEKVPPELPPEKTEGELIKEELEATKNKYLRALADFDNYKKRVALEQDQFIKFANERLILELLPVLDNLIRALKTAEKSKTHKELTKGIALVLKQMEDGLKKFGVEEIKALHLPYDPNLHEAILQKEHKGPENVILEEVQKGYTLNGKVIRPSMVIVSKKGEK